MTKDERNEAFAKCLESFPKRYGRINFRDHLILRIAFDFGIDAAIENLNIPELKKTIAELEAQIEKVKHYLDYDIPHDLINEATTKIWRMLK